MKRFMITFHGEEMERLGVLVRYAYYANEIGEIELPEVIKALRRCGVICDIEAIEMSNCKCIMIEEDN